MKLEDFKRIEASEALEKLIQEGKDTFGAEATLKLCSELSGALKEYRELNNKESNINKPL